MFYLLGQVRQRSDRCPVFKQILIEWAQVSLPSVSPIVHVSK
jgi:hypothetical protein